jgi:hypothetical protein
MVLLRPLERCSRSGLCGENRKKNDVPDLKGKTRKFALRPVPRILVLTRNEQA